MIKIFLNFDFYGAGNIGDDLMLDGFLKGLENKKYEFYCSIPRDSIHQQNRFPEINYVNVKDRIRIAEECNVWAGVGDTPIQIKSGEWFLNKLSADNEYLKLNTKKYYLIGIGAEKEAVAQKEKFSIALESVDHIWTRDSSTTEILINDLNIKENRVSTSSDLANISLSRMFIKDEENENFKYEIGLCYYDECTDLENLSAIRIFLKKISKNKKKLLLCNDVNLKGMFEYNLYQRMFSGFERVLNNIKICRPEYYKSITIADLIKHYSDCRVIMSSRYHSILAAAWAGCKIVILERSSKVSALAQELGLKEIKKPFDSEKLFKAFKNAKAVERDVLNSLLESCFQSIKNFEELTKD